MSFCFLFVSVFLMSVWMSFCCLFVSVWMSLCYLFVSVFLMSDWLSLGHFVCLSVCLHLCTLSLCPSISLPVCLYVWLSLCPSVSMCVCLDVSPISFCCVWLSVGLSACLTHYLYPSIPTIAPSLLPLFSLLPSLWFLPFLRPLFSLLICLSFFPFSISPSFSPIRFSSPFPFRYSFSRSLFFLQDFPFWSVSLFPLFLFIFIIFYSSFPLFSLLSRLYSRLLYFSFHILSHWKRIIIMMITFATNKQVKGEIRKMKIKKWIKGENKR